MAPRLVLATLALLAAALVVRSQDAPGWQLAPVTDPMNHSFPIPANSRGNGPGVRSFDSPYLLLNKTDGLALWYTHGAHVYPVTFSGGKVPPVTAAPQVVNSGGNWFLVYVVEGGNEFWQLDAEQATQVKLGDGKVFSQRSHITHGGDRAVLYQGSYTGKTDLFEIKNAVASPLTLKDHADHGTAQYAWDVGGKLLLAFYMDGTHDFYWREDGKLNPCWERNGNDDYDSQIDSINDTWWHGRLFLNLVRRDNKAEIWTIRDGKLASITANANRWYKPGLFAAGRDGLYFIARGKDAPVLQVTDGVSLRTVELGGALASKTSLEGRGGGVLVASTGFENATCWLVNGAVQKLGTYKLDSSAHYLLAATSGERDVVECTGEQGKRSLKVFQAGKETGGTVGGLPEDFGSVESAWNVEEDGKPASYAVEKSPAGNYRLWQVNPR